MIEEENKEQKRLKTRQTINEAGHEFFESIYNTSKELGHIAGEFMALNEEYVLNHCGEEETNGTVDILRTGFTTNQKRFLERLCVTLEKSFRGESAISKGVSFCSFSRFVTSILGLFLSLF